MDHKSTVILDKEAKNKAKSVRIVKNTFEFTCGSPGTPSSRRTLQGVQLLVKRAAGYPPLMEHEKPLVTLSDRVRRVYHKALRAGVRTERLGDGLFVKLSAEDQRAVDRVREIAEAGGWVPSPFNLYHIDRYVGMPLSVVPHNWLAYVRKEGGRGRSAGPRTYYEAIHLLAHITSAYVDLQRVRGEMLFLNSERLCETYGMSQSTYSEALRFLGDEGFITRVTIRGFVPWLALKKGSFSFAAPRVAKLRAMELVPPSHMRGTKTLT